MSWEEIIKANETIKTTDIKGKAYAEVNQRIKAFRMVYPTGTIQTEMLSNENGVCVFKATVGYCEEDSDRIIPLGVGHAYEREDSSFINRTSFIEVCETSAVGRALGMCGFGIDTSVASYEEVANAIENQQSDQQTKSVRATSRQVEILKSRYMGANMAKLLKAQGIERIEDISLEAASALIEKLNKKELQVKPMMEGK